MRRPSLRTLSLRIKLTLIFAGVMALVLAGIGSFLFFRTKANLDNAIRASLRSRAGDLVQSVRDHGAADGGGLIEPGERFAQVLTTGGTILQSRPERTNALLSRDELRLAARGTRFFERPEHDRLLASPVRLDGQTVVAVVDASLAQREQALEGLQRALFIGGPLALLFASVLAYGIASGALRPVELMRRRASQITVADPSARLPVPRSRDEIHRLATTLNDMLTRLAHAAELERSFVANASHELRTPLTRLQIELELALRHGRTTDDLRTAARAAMADAREMTALAEDLLVLARVDGGHLPVHVEELEVDDVLASVATELQRDPLVGARAVVAHTSGLEVRADPQQLVLALRNMGRNALVHGAGTVTLGAQRTATGVEMWVQDEGGPLAAELLGTAFERFARAPDAANRAGAGLGLAIVREIARAHGASAELVNTRGGVRCVLTFSDR